jgi:O-antigen/teichoic acid export membrane protein
MDHPFKLKRATRIAGEPPTELALGSRASFTPQARTELLSPSDAQPGAPLRSRTHNYVEGVTSGWIAKFLPVVAGFWLTPFVLLHIGREAFGFYALASSVMGWMALLDFGLTPGLKAHLARNSARPDPDAVSRLVSSTFFPQLAVALLVLLGGAAAASSVPSVFAVRGALADQAAGLTVLLAASLAVSLATQSFSAVLVAHQHLNRENAARLALVAVRTAVTFLLLWRGDSLVAVGVAHLAAVGVSSVLTLCWAYRLTPGLRIRPSLMRWRDLGLVAGCGAWFSAGAAAGLLISGADRAVVGKLVSLEAVTVLSVTASAYVFAEATLSQLVNNARPALGQLFGEHRPAAVARAYRQLLAGVSGLGLVSACAIWAANEAFVGAWVGPEHYGGTLLDAMLGVNCVVALVILPSRAVLAAHLTVRPQTLARLIEGGLNLALTIWLTSRLGLVGTVLSTSLAALATSFWYLPRLTLLTLGLETRWVREISRKVAVFTLLLLPAAWLGRCWAASAGGFAGAAAGALFTVACGLLLMWVMLLDAWVKTRLIAALASILGSPPPQAIALGANAAAK